MLLVPQMPQSQPIVAGSADLEDPLRPLLRRNRGQLLVTTTPQRTDLGFGQGTGLVLFANG